MEENNSCCDRHCWKKPADSLSSKHFAVHVLYVSHTCEALDCRNLIVLKHMEEKSYLKWKVVKCMPSFRSFLSKRLIVTVVNALCKLVTNDGHELSIYEEFDNFLSNKQKSKNFAFTRNSDLVYLDTVLLLSYIILRI